MQLSVGKSRMAQEIADLLEPDIWQKTQIAIRSGQIKDSFPFPGSLRFRNAHPGRTDDADESDTPRDLFGATAPHLSPDLLPEVEIE